MRRVVALVASICFLLSLAGGALAAPGDAVLYTQEQCRQMGMYAVGSGISSAALGDTVYTLFDKGVYAWQVGQEKPYLAAGDTLPAYYGSYEDAQQVYGDKSDTLLSGLVAGENVLYGLNGLNGKLFSLTFADGKTTFGTPVQLDWSGMEQQQGGYSGMKTITRLTVLGNRLYAMIRNDQDYNNPEFVSFDLATGAKTVHEVPFVQSFTTYKDGKLLLMVYDRDNAYQAGKMEPEKPTLSVFDPATGTATPAGSFSDAYVFAMAYQAETDTLLYTTRSKIMAMKGLGTASVAAYAPVDYMDEAPGFILPGGLYAVSTWSGLFVRNTDPQYTPTSTLTVYNGSMDDAAMAFSERYPQTPLTFRDNLYFSTMEELAKAMASNDKSFDVYWLDIGYQDLAGLMDKGYCMDLSASPALSAAVGKMYPFLQQAVEKDGKLFALPVEMYASGISISPKVWKDAGLADRIPTSFVGLMEFIAWWSQEGIEEYPDISLVQGVDQYDSTLLYMVMSQYINECQSRGEELSFDTPLFRKLMGLYEQIDMDALNDTATSTSEDEMMMTDSGESSSLIQPYSSWLDLNSYGDYYDNYQQPLMVPMEEGGQITVPMSIRVLFVNPNTPNADAALKYLEVCLEKQRDDQRVMMFPDENQGVPSPYYEQNLKSWQEELDKQKKLLETAKPEQVKDIQAIIDSLQDTLAHKDEYYWQISPEAIATYRQSAQYCYAARPNILSYASNDGTSQITTLMERYRQKQIPLEQFITESEKKLRMILLERQ